MLAPLAVEVNDPRDEARIIRFDLSDVTVWPDFAPAGLFGHRDDRRQRARLGSHLAAEVLAETAVKTGAASPIGLRDNGHGSGKSKPSQFASPPFDQYARRFWRQRRERVGLGTGRIQRACSGKSRDSKFPFGFGVIRLELLVTDRPICKAGARNRSQNAALHEVDFVKAPVVSRKVDRAAAHQARIAYGRLDYGLVFLRLSKGIRLALVIVGDRRLKHGLEFVVPEV